VERRPPFSTPRRLANEGFGRLIRQARVSKGLSQKDLAARVLKGNGEAISAQYLNDIEHGRRLPPGEGFVKQLAEQLGLDGDGLLAAAGRLPADIRELSLQNLGEAAEIIKAFRKKTS
jgi:transcriptional regulator with XRE-family HTH domain